MRSAASSIHDVGCPINCSGGCPGCAPDEHREECVSLWFQTETRAHLRCHCDHYEEAFDDSKGG